MIESILTFAVITLGQGALIGTIMKPTKPPVTKSRQHRKPKRRFWDLYGRKTPKSSTISTTQTAGRGTSDLPGRQSITRWIGQKMVCCVRRKMPSEKPASPKKCVRFSQTVLSYTVATTGSMTAPLKVGTKSPVDDIGTDSDSSSDASSDSSTDDSEGEIIGEEALTDDDCSIPRLMRMASSRRAGQLRSAEMREELQAKYNDEQDVIHHRKRQRIVQNWLDTTDLDGCDGTHSSRCVHALEGLEAVAQLEQMMGEVRLHRECGRL